MQSVGHSCLEVASLLWFLILGIKNNEGLKTNPLIVEHPENLYVVKNEPATLNCKAVGDPPPVITWYRNGHLVETTDDSPSSHRMILPSGQLFFLRVIHNRNRKPDVGVYYCNATNPETRFSAISRTAVLDIASIELDFLLQPRDTVALIGGKAELECQPPHGEPEPRIRWKKDGLVLKNTGERISLSDSGNLIIEDIRYEDAGRYTCTAYNVAVERDSKAVRLSVKEKPKVVTEVKELIVNVNTSVFLRCLASGVPLPSITWRKSSDVADVELNDRSTVLEDGHLRIDNVQLSDDGLYVCRAENSIGWEEADVRLIVHSSPSFLVRPIDRVVGLGKRVTFQCEVTGNPRPAVFWNKETSQVLMFPSQDHGRFSVSDDGTLMIESAQREDSGEYTCKALSTSGIAVAKATLEVRESLMFVPPVILYGPQNQTLPLGDTEAVLPCSATADPQPVIKWYKDGRILSTTDPQLSIVESGSLHITELRKSDSGFYTCKAVNDVGETTRSASLVVETPLNQSVIFHRIPEPSTFPGPPSKPVAGEVTESSIQLTWRANSNFGASPLRGFSLEYFGQDITDSWVLVAEYINDQTYTVTRLQPGTHYAFLVRAENDHGLGPPSPVSVPIKTKGVVSKQSISANNYYDSPLIIERLSGQVIGLYQPQTLNSTAIKLSWEVRRSHRFIEGLLIQYRPTFEQELQFMTSSRHRRSEFNTITLHSNSMTSYLLTNLQKCTWYEIRLQPYYAGVKGQESNTVRIRTAAGVPSEPARNVVATMVNESTLYLRWTHPPLTTSCNELLFGYKIYIRSVDSLVNEEVVVNSSVDNVYIHHLQQNNTYQLQMSAFNHVGESVASDIIWIGQPDVMSVKSPSFLYEPWFLVMLTAVTGCFLWLGYCLFGAWLYRKRRSLRELNTDKSMMKDTCCKEYKSASKSFQSIRSSNYPQNETSPVISSNSEVPVTYQDLPVHSTPGSSGNEVQPFSLETSAPHPLYANGDFVPPLSLRGTGRLTAFHSVYASKDVHAYSANEKDINIIPEQRIDPSSSSGSGRKSPVLYLPPPPDHPPSPASPDLSSSIPPLYHRNALDFQVSASAVPVWTRPVYLYGQLPAFKSQTSSGETDWRRMLLLLQQNYKNQVNV